MPGKPIRNFTVEDRTRLILAFIEAHAPPGYRKEDDSPILDIRRRSFRLEWKVGWGGSVRVNFDAQECRAVITWGATDRTVTMATAALALYRGAVEFAALLECYVSEMPEVVDPESQPPARPRKEPRP